MIISFSPSLLPKNRISPSRSFLTEKGAVAPTMLGLMIVFLTVALGVLSLTQTTYRSMDDGGKYMQAKNIAEGGIDHVIARLQSNPQWRTMADEQDVALGTGTYYLSALKTVGSGLEAFRMQGWVPNRTDPRAIKSELYVELAPVYFKPWSGAALGDQGIPVANGETDSYNGSLGPYSLVPHLQNGDIGTNNPAANSISVSSNGHVLGNVYYPPVGGSAATVTNSGTITGTIGPNPADTRFTPVPTPSESATQYNFASVTYLKPITTNPVTLTLTDSTGTSNLGTLAQPLQPGVYVIKKDAQGDSLKLSGQGGLAIQNYDFTILYLEGNADVTGNGISMTSTRPSNLQIYGMTTCTSVKIGGNGAFYGVVYAPQADIILNGAGSSGEVFGSLAGRQVSFSGNGTVIHYDESLRNLVGVIQRYRLSSWTNLR
jgi:hypothetical protein